LKRILLFAAVCVLASGRLQGAESLQLDTNESLFAVLAAINAAGYDEGIALPDNSPLRQQVRDYLSKQNIAVLPDLRQFYKKHLARNGVQDLSQYVSYALSLAGPPDFHWRTRDIEVPPDALALEGFTPLLIDFYSQAGLAELWRRVQPAYERELSRYHTPLVAMTNAVDGYLRIANGVYLGRHFQVSVDLLGAPEQVQTRNYGDDAFVVVTASETPRLFDIRHAYLLYQIDPILLKYTAALNAKKSLMDLAQQAPLDDVYKKDIGLLADTSLVKAIEARLDRNSSGVQQAARQGYIFTPFFAEQLPVFEKQDQGMRLYISEMLDAIDLDREAKRIAAIKFDAAPLMRAARQVQVAAPEPEVSPSGKLLARAEDLYAARNLDEARDFYLKSLEERGGADEHAQAWYGLARISVLRNQPDAAVRLFEKTLASSPDAPTKAWALVYLARLSKASNDPARAKKLYQEALTVEGASERARQAAQTESQTIK
jgi:tetratricopeptide (TPR) repeat protein